MFTDFKGEHRQFEDLSLYPLIGFPGMQRMIAAGTLYQLMDENLVGVLNKLKKMTWMPCLTSGLFAAFIPKALRTQRLDETIAGGRLRGVPAILGKLGLQIGYSLFQFGDKIGTLQKKKDQKASSWRTLVQNFRYVRFSKFQLRHHSQLIFPRIRLSITLSSYGTWIIFGGRSKV